ncbi:hypothetical protein [Methanobrevibacter oralis]|nr:hypothetical protein [Methanobrevibacter oralis]
MNAMIVKENVNQNSLSIMKNTAIFQNNTKIIKQKDYLQHWMEII